MEELTMSTYSIGAMNQLGDALEKAGFSAEDVTKLRRFHDLKDFKDVLNGKAEISYPEHLIDCDADPFIPDGLSVEEHKKGGLFKFDPNEISLYLSKGQKKGVVSGYDLRKELADKPVANANVLDYLLAHPELIPEEWKGKFIFFWGTIYRYLGMGLCVRCLQWRNSIWCWNYNLLNIDFGSCDPAALTNLILDFSSSSSDPGYMDIKLLKPKSWQFFKKSNK